jgi:hypothetical protein
MAERRGVQGAERRYAADREAVIEMQHSRCIGMQLSVCIYRECYLDAAIEMQSSGCRYRDAAIEMAVIEM